MIKKIFSTIVFIVILFVLPLVFNFQLITHPFVLLSAIVIIILLNTQPQMDFNESKINKSTDRGTMLLIALVSVIGHIASIIEWEYFRSTSNNLTWNVILGGSLLILGISFRIWAIRTLKSAFSATVQIKKGQKIIKSGPYKIIRHPSYTGAWILMIGDAILFSSIIGMIILGVIMFFVYMKRIETEEYTLQNAFGEEYSDYMKSTWKLIIGY